VLGATLRIGEACTFHSFRTNNYKLHFLESPSGLKVQGVAPFKAGALAAHTISLSKRAWSCGPQIVLNTGAEAGDMRDHLNYIYGAIYVECVLKNPAYTPGRPFRRAPPRWFCPLRVAQQHRCKLKPPSAANVGRACCLTRCLAAAASSSRRGCCST